MIKTLRIAAAVLTATLAAISIAIVVSAGAPARICVRVSDAMTGEPVAGAVVVIAETGDRLVTGDDGRTATVSARLRRDMRFDRIMRQSWAQVTVLAYADGYAPMALLYARADRNGGTVCVYMFEDSGRGALSMIESPDPDWVNALSGKYAP